MEENPTLSCRGCMGKVFPDKLYSFAWTEVKNLFEHCTAIKIPPDEHGLPQQICSECYANCEQWQTFKYMCQDVNDHLQKKSQKTINVPSEQIRIKEEPEDDLVEWTGFQDTPDDDLDSYNFGKLVPDEEEQAELPVDSSCPVTNNAKPSDTDWKCLVCDKMVPQSIHLREHLKKHYTEEDPKCPICEESFTRGSKVYPHVIAVHLENSSKRRPVVPTKETPKKLKVAMESETLSEMTAQEDNLPTRRRSNTARNEIPVENKKRNTAALRAGKMVECPVCKKHFRNLPALFTHFVVHTSESPYECVHCKLSFNHRSNFYCHTSKYHPRQPGVSGYVIKEGSIFASHTPWELMGYSVSWVDATPTKNPRQSRHHCDQCRIRFASTDDLREHIETQHKPRETHPHKCSICAKSFTTKILVDIHMETHSEDGLLRCKHCTGFFRRPTSLKRHRKICPSLRNTRDINDEEPAKKSGVLQMFKGRKSKRNAKDTDGKPLVCQYCEKKYASRRGLQKHFQNHHKEEETKDDDCESIDSGVVAGQALGMK